MTDRESTQVLTACRAPSLCAFVAVTLMTASRVKSVRLHTILAFVQMWFELGRTQSAGVIEAFALALMDRSKVAELND